MLDTLTAHRRAARVALHVANEIQNHRYPAANADANRDRLRVRL